MSSTPWANARVAHLLSVHRAAATLLEDKTLEGANPDGYDQASLHEKHRDYRNLFLSGLYP